MTGKSKLKGDRFERWVVNKAREFQIKAERVLLGAQANRSFIADVTMTVMGAMTRWECKWDGDGFKSLYKWINGNHGVFIKADDCEALAVVRADYLMQLIQAAGVGRWNMWPTVTIKAHDDVDAE